MIIYACSYYSFLRWHLNIEDYAHIRDIISDFIEDGEYFC